MANKSKGAPHLVAFINAARYYIGAKETGKNSYKKGDKINDIFKRSGCPKGTSWCAAFVIACASRANVLGRVIGTGSKNLYAIGVARNTVKHCGGSWIDGPLITGKKKGPTPMPGDLITFGSSGSKKHGHNHARHVGIVEYVSNGKVYTIEGNSGKKTDGVYRCSYSLNYKNINCYVRPKWSRVGDDVSAYMNGGTSVPKTAVSTSFVPLYTTRNDRHDMTIRQVGYFDGSFNPSNKSSGIAMSVINYTSLLGDLYKMYGPKATGIKTKVDTSKLKGATKVVVDYMINMGCTASAAAGIAGCLTEYSSIRTAFSTRIYTNWLYGICAWTGQRFNDMKEVVGKDWDTDLSGQLEFMITEIESDFEDIIPSLRVQPLTKEGVNNAVVAMMSVYNQFYTDSSSISAAKKYAQDIYSKIVIKKS